MLIRTDAIQTMRNEVFRIHIGSPRNGFISAADNAMMDEIIATHFRQWITTDAIRGECPRGEEYETEQIKTYMVCSADYQRTAPSLDACVSALSSAFPRAFLMVERKDAIIEVHFKGPEASSGSGIEL